jgi:hypothetical protein
MKLMLTLFVAIGVGMGSPAAWADTEGMDCITTQNPDGSSTITCVDRYGKGMCTTCQPNNGPCQSYTC